MPFELVVPDFDFEGLDRQAVKSLARRLGRCRLVSTRAFMGLIPAIERFEIFVDEGCLDLYEYCAKFASLGREEVNRALVLHRKIGQYPCLWRQLSSGDTGISKLERVAPFVTTSNAEWFAQQVRALTKPLLEELLRNLGSKRSRPTVSAGSPDRGAHLDRSGPDRASAGVHGDDPPIPGALPVLRPRAATESAVGGPDAPIGVSPRGSQDESTPDSDSILPRLRLVLEVDPLGDKRLRDLQEMYERVHGRPIGLGALFVLLATDAIARGMLTGPCQSAEQAGSRTDPEAGTPEQELRPGESALPRGAAAQSPGDPENRAEPARRTFQAKLVEVVVSIAETGWRFVRTAAGWLPIQGSSQGGFLSPGQPVPLANLRIAAIVAAQGATGRHVPAAVERYILARSGGYCEAQDCRNRSQDLHHRRRFALDPSHHPDDLFGVCSTHHGSSHAGLITNEQEDPAIWRTIRQGEEPCLNAADRAYQRSRIGGRQALCGQAIRPSPVQERVGL